MTEMAENPRCHVGSKSDNPCPREATECFRAEGPEPNMCAPHARAYRLGAEEDGWYYALEKLEEWTRAAAEDDMFGQLEQAMTNVRDEVREHYAAAHARWKAAGVAADDHDGRLSFEQAERMAALLIRCDGLANACTKLQDAPEDTFGALDKWLIVDTLAKASSAASEDYERYQRGIGFPEPEAVAGPGGEVHVSA